MIEIFLLLEKVTDDLFYVCDMNYKIRFLFLLLVGKKMAYGQKE